MKPQRYITKNNTKDKILKYKLLKTDINKNKVEKNKSMDNISMSEIEELVQATKCANDETLPKRKVKIDKKDKGLLERAENTRIVLTEDNKMLLGD